jgi:hypothetical protein
MAKVKTYVKTIGNVGFTFETREVKIKNGTENIGTVDVFAPNSLESLSEYIDLGHETVQHAMKLYKSALAVELQAMARRSKTSGKMSVLDFDRLYDTLSMKQKQQKFDAIRAAVQKLYDAEQTSTEDVENTEIDEDNG